MDGLNRFLILVLLLALLYALYQYQQQLPTVPETPSSNKKSDNRLDLIEVDSTDNMSFGSIDDMSTGYKPDSVLDSLDSNESLNSNFFFQ